MNLTKLGLRIKDLRKKKNFAQEALSEAASMNGQHLGEIERGNINISIQNLDKIAKALDVSLIDLLDTGHQQTKKVLYENIRKMLDTAEYEQIQMIHRIIQNVLT